MLSRASLTSRLRTAWDLARIDLAAFLGIAIVIVVSHRMFMRYGACFDDPSRYFHFGHRVLEGEVPYRDYVFPGGPLPIYVDAAFQHVLERTYLASLYAGMAIKILRVFVLWMIVRRLAGWQAAIALAAFCSLEPSFSYIHHSSAAYTELFVSLAGLFLLLASRSEGRWASAHLVLAGASASLTVSTRPSAAGVIAMVLLAATAILLARREWFTPRRFLALWGGAAAGFAVVLVALAIIGALGPGLQQMVVDAPERHGARGLEAVLDAISGGALVVPGSSWWGGFLFHLALPGMIIAAAVYLLARDREIPARTVALLAAPAALLWTLFARYAAPGLITDLPGLFLLVTSVFAVTSPDRTRRWFGIDPLVAMGLGALPLAASWALEIQQLGRAEADTQTLIGGVVLLTLASTRLAGRAKTAICIVLALVALVHFVYVVRQRNPFAHPDVGTIKENAFTLHLRQDRHPMFRRMRIDEPAAGVLGWLSSEIGPGRTCFVHGNFPALYEVLGCKNPSRLDSTAPDFITAEDAAEAIEVLRASPPDYILVHEERAREPDAPARPPRNEGMNPTSATLDADLASVLARYESLGSAGEKLDPLLAKRAAARHDQLGTMRLYRRRP